MPPLIERVLTVKEAAAVLRVGERSYYEAVRRGELPAVRIGRRIVVPGAMLQRFLSGDDPDRSLQLVRAAPIAPPSAGPA